MSRSNCAQGEGKTKKEEVLLKLGNFAMWNPVQVKGVERVLTNCDAHTLANPLLEQHEMICYGFDVKNRRKSQIGPTLQQQ